VCASAASERLSSGVSAWRRGGGPAGRNGSHRKLLSGVCGTGQVQLSGAALVGG
jgi:hypothetical protein